jgi:hypothetical protein
VKESNTYNVMKNSIILFTLIAMLSAGFFGCEPITYGELGDPFSKTEAIEGTWNVTSVLQIDETALSQGGKYTELDITDAFNFKEYSITFNLSADTLPTTFSVEYGAAPNFIDTLGTWTFDDMDFPTSIEFTAPDSVSATSQLKLIAPPRDLNPLRVKFQRYAGGDLIISYQFTFEKQTQ